MNTKARCSEHTTETTLNCPICQIVSNMNRSSGTTMYDSWSLPERIKINEVGESIEIFYKQTSNLIQTIYPSPAPRERIFKIVYSCVDGKWHKSDPIYGKIIPAQGERYEF